MYWLSCHRQEVIFQPTKKIVPYILRNALDGLGLMKYCVYVDAVKGKGSEEVGRGRK